MLGSHAVRADKQGLLQKITCKILWKRYSYRRLFWVMPRVPSECPQAVADLYHDCVRPNPAERPTAKEIVARLEDCIGLGQVWLRHIQHCVYVCMPLLCCAYLSTSVPWQSDCFAQLLGRIRGCLQHQT